MNIDALKNLIRDNAGKTDAEIAALAQADKRTASAIPLDLLSPFLTKYGLQFKFDQAARSEAVPVELRAALFSFNNYLSGPNRNLDTNDAELAPIIDAAMLGAIGAGVLTQQQAAAIVAMGGGRLLSDATEADVTAARAAMARDADANAIRSRIESAVATFMNEKLNPAASDPNATLPTWEDFVAGLNS